MKKKIIKLYFIVFLLSAGCFGSRETIVMFETPYGPIEKGARMVDIMSTLGNPSYINSGQHQEVWHYYLEEGQHLIVVIANNKLIKIEEELAK